MTVADRIRILTVEEEVSVPEEETEGPTEVSIVTQLNLEIYILCA